MMLFPLHPLMAGTADFHKLKWRTDTVKLYLLVLELCSNEIEKSCSQAQTHQKSHSHPQQFQGLQPNNSDVRGSGYLDKIFPAAYTFEIYQSRTSGEHFRPNHAHCTSLLKDFFSPTWALSPKRKRKPTLTVASPCASHRAQLCAHAGLSPALGGSPTWTSGDAWKSLRVHPILAYLGLLQMEPPEWKICLLQLLSIVQPALFSLPRRKHNLSFYNQPSTHRDRAVLQIMRRHREGKKAPSVTPGTQPFLYTPLPAGREDLL